MTTEWPFWPKPQIIRWLGEEPGEAPAVADPGRPTSVADVQFSWAAPTCAAVPPEPAAVFGVEHQPVLRDGVHAWLAPPQPRPDWERRMGRQPHAVDPKRMTSLSRFQADCHLPLRLGGAGRHRPTRRRHLTFRAYRRDCRSCGALSWCDVRHPAYAGLHVSYADLHGWCDGLRGCCGARRPCCDARRPCCDARRPCCDARLCCGARPCCGARLCCGARRPCCDARRPCCDARRWTSSPCRRQRLPPWPQASGPRGNGCGR